MEWLFVLVVVWIVSKMPAIWFSSNKPRISSDFDKYIDPRLREVFEEKHNER